RTVYVGNLPPGTLAAEVLDQVHTGPLDSYYALPAKSCAFLAFITPVSAQTFYSLASIHGFRVRGVETRIAWGKPAAIPAPVARDIVRGATRCVLISGLVPSESEVSLRERLSIFGTIEHVHLPPPPPYGRVYFCAVAQAVRCVEALSVTTGPSGLGWAVCYGRDRCGPTMDIHPEDVISAEETPTERDGEGVSGSQQQESVGTGQVASKRTVYLGNLDPSTTLPDLCDAVRGGGLERVRLLLPARPVAFVSFLSPEDAASFVDHHSRVPLVVKGRKLKAGWGRASALPMAVERALRAGTGGPGGGTGGASRNIYVGGVGLVGRGEEEAESLVGSFLSRWGTIERCNALPGRDVVFVGFADIRDAVRVVE
ncbi:MAG: hypothetical protein DHS80DRAFT_6434, partial [Piptocephalis tieghemiana]